VLFQVFCCERDKAELSAENEAWLAAKGPYRSSLPQIAPATSALRWPPAEVFTIDALPVVAGRLRDGLGAVSDQTGYRLPGILAGGPALDLVLSVGPENRVSYGLRSSP
jgi:hypothetical protein